MSTQRACFAVCRSSMMIVSPMQSETCLLLNNRMRSARCLAQEVLLVRMRNPLGMVWRVGLQGRVLLLVPAQGDLRGVRVLRARGEGQSPLHHPYPYAPLPLFTRSNRNVRGHKGTGA